MDYKFFKICLKIVYPKKYWVDTQEVHKKSNVMSTINRRNFMLVKYGHKLSHDQNNILPYRERNLRSNRKILLKTRKFKTAKVEKSFLSKSVKYWNSLPEELKKVRDNSCFATRLKKEMLLGKINFPE